MDLLILPVIFTLITFSASCKPTIKNSTILLPIYMMVTNVKLAMLVMWYGYGLVRIRWCNIRSFIFIHFEIDISTFKLRIIIDLIINRLVLIIHYYCWCTLYKAIFWIWRRIIFIFATTIHTFFSYCLQFTNKLFFLLWFRFLLYLFNLLNHFSYCFSFIILHKSNRDKVNSNKPVVEIFIINILI